ncbi:MAG: class I SAM-dependent methyltransferase [Candidatus Aenigmatarchaeota archaeon]
MDYRMEEIYKMIPREVESVLDIGCGGRYLKKKFKKYIGVDLKNAEIKMDLNKTQKLPFPNKSIDCIILSQILEHLNTVEELIEECKRICKKFIIVGLPNEFFIIRRFQFLINKWGGGYKPYGHKHIFNLKTAREFVKNFFGSFENEKPLVGNWRGKHIFKIRLFLAKIYPSLFAREFYFLIKIRKIRK